MDTPKREREEPATSEDEEMDDPDPKRRPSAVDTADQDMGDPAPTQRTSAVDYGGQYATAARPQLGIRYPLSKIARQPLRGYPFGLKIGIVRL